MGYSALSHGIPGFYDAVAWAAQHTARAEQHRIGSSGCVKFKQRREGQCVRCSGQQFVPDEITPWFSQPASVTSRRPLFSPRKTCSEANLGPSDKVWVISASTSEELLAAATLRAQIFYTYPQADMTLSGIEGVKARVANDFLANDLLKTRVKSEFNRESKFDALDMRVKCLLAVCRQSTLESFSLSGGRVATPSHLVPPIVSSVGMNGDEPLVAIGTLDIQVQKSKKGAKSYFPVEQEDTLEQAYIFNVCVIKDARRMGVAKALMVAALKVAKEMELQILFVHVEANNQSALALYNSLGYAVEEEESVEVESLLKRPRRILLSFWVI
ncbi:hypothetical protein M758_6G006800 [Ceratodon purpureus]|nr:hypothetical protein M758_6G006800 [Ceratodon purpureus]